MLNAVEDASQLDELCAADWITEVVGRVKSGKEATVYLCAAHPRTGAEFLAAKVYKSSRFRSFKNDALYQEGRVILDRRLRRAVRAKSDSGRSYQAGAWIDTEYEVLRLLHARGCDVPKPYARSANVILMEYIGDAESAAPPLRAVHLDTAAAHRLFHRLLHNIEVWLACDRVHGDLSAYNVLYWQGHIKVIDFPQAVDPRANFNAQSLLLRDVTNICNYFAKYNITADAEVLLHRLWKNYLRSSLSTNP
jgi:RIO kinase 1